MPPTPVITPSPERPQVFPNPEEARQAVLANIRSLQQRSGRGLFALALFITVSIGAVRDFSFLRPFHEPFDAALGTPPTANMISALLLLYLFSAVVLALGKMWSGTGRHGGMAHVGYLTGFYLFYHFARALEDNFWAVFIGGLTILGMESYALWNYCTEEIRKEEEILADLEKREKLSAWSGE